MASNAGVNRRFSLRGRRGGSGRAALPEDPSRGAARRREEAIALGRQAGEKGLPPEEAIGPDSAARRLFAAIGKRVTELAAWRGVQLLAPWLTILGEADGAMERAEAEAQRLEQQAQEHRRLSAEARSDAERVRARRASLPRYRRGHRRDPVEVGVSGTAFVGADVLILKISQTLLPGLPAEHAATAVLISLGLFGYAHGVGWAAEAIASKVGSQVRDVVIGGGVVVALLTFPVFAIVSLQDFRSDSLTTLAERTGLPISNPTFFGFAQAMMLIGAALASFRLHAGAEGRRLLLEAEELVADMLDENVAAEDLMEDAREALTAGEELVAKAAAARQEVEAIRRSTEQAVRVAQTEADLLAEWHETAYLIAYHARLEEVPQRQGLGMTVRNRVIAALAGAVVLGVGLLAGVTAAMAALLAVVVGLVVLVAVSSATVPDPLHPYAAALAEGLE